MADRESRPSPEALLDAAAATGTWVELNAAPKRLDLDWRWWLLAKQKGVKCVIDPDAHRTERLQDLWFGVGIARKGWLTNFMASSGCA